MPKAESHRSRIPRALPWLTRTTPTANGTSTSFTLDARGLPTTATNGRGQTAAVAYDAAGRVTSKTYAGGATEDIKLPVEAWLLGNRYVYERPVNADLARVEVDPNHHFPDVRRANNQWQGTSRP